MTRARLYGRVADEFPLTLAAMTARDRERDWEIRAKELGEQDRARRSDVANKRLRYAALAQKKVEEAFGWMKKAKLENSLAAYDEALELGKSAGGAWEGRAEAEKGFDDITQYLMKGRDLLLRAEQLREEGEPQKAFELMVEAAKSHYLVPEVQGMKIPVMFRSFPAGARVTG